METMSVQNPDAVARSVEILRSRGVILYPTDTLYGLGADAFSDEAVEKIYAIKGRNKQKPIHAIVADMAMAERYGIVNDTARKLAETFLPGPLTLILKKRQEIDTGIARDIDTIGIRIPNDEFCLQLARKFDGPITATSANVSGGATRCRVADILEQLGAAADTIELIIDASDPLHHPPAGGVERLPSTVVDASTNKPKIFRDGAIPAMEILRHLN